MVQPLRNAMFHWAMCLVPATWFVQSAQAGVVTSYRYDHAGQLTKTWATDGATGPTLSHTETEYDLVGRQTKVTQFGSETEGTKNVVTEHIYDVRGSLATKRVTTGESGDRQFFTTVYTYDNVGRQVAAAGPVTTGATFSFDGSEPRTVYEYDKTGNATKQYVRVQSGENYALTQTEYDAAHRVTKVIDPANHYRMISYNSRGNVIREKSYDGATSQLLKQTRMTYDAAGRVVRRCQFRIEEGRDSDDADEESYDGIVDYTYDRAGRVLAEMTYDSGYPARPLVTRSRYDGFGRLTKRVDPKGYWDQMDYDYRGFVTKQIRYDGQQHETVLTYDNRGRVLESTAKGAPDLDTGFAYDALGRRTLVTDPTGQQTLHVYDLMGRKTSMTEDVGNADPTKRRQTEYVYSKWGLLSQQIAHNDTGSQTTGYAYANNGQVGTITYPDSGTLSFEYYPSGAVSRRTDQAGGILDYTYDLRGLLIVKRRPAPDESYILRFEYDGLGRMVTAKTGPDGAVDGEIVYHYDGLSRLIDENQRASLSRAAKDVTSVYDQVGNRTRLSYPQ